MKKRSDSHLTYLNRSKWKNRNSSIRKQKTKVVKFKAGKEWRNYTLPT